MSTKAKIRPIGKVRNPELGKDVEEGDIVILNSFWRRKARFGDIEILEEFEEESETEVKEESPKEIEEPPKETGKNGTEKSSPSGNSGSGGKKKKKKKKK